MDRLEEQLKTEAEAQTENSTRATDANVLKKGGGAKAKHRLMVKHGKITVTVETLTEALLCFYQQQTGPRRAVSV